MSKHALTILAVSLLAFMLVGCCPATRLNVTVELDDALKAQLTRDLQVDLVGLNATQHARWRNYSMTKYWEAGDPMRNSVPTYTITLNAKNPSATLWSDNSIWDKWIVPGDKDMPRLYVLALLPGIIADKDGNDDPRRQILPLGSCRWDTKDIHIIVQKTGIITRPAPKTKPTD